MTLSPLARWTLRVTMALGLAIIYVPLAIVLLNSFNADRTFAWPPTSLTLEWWSRAWDNEGAREALWTSVRTGLAATAIALVGRQKLRRQPSPTLLAEQISVGTGRHKMGVQDRLCHGLDPHPLADELVAPRDEPSQRQGRGVGYPDLR